MCIRSRFFKIFNFQFSILNKFSILNLKCRIEDKANFTTEFHRVLHGVSQSFLVIERQNWADLGNLSMFDMIFLLLKIII
ncbi:MAG: hypothetical protein A2X61_03085 [Ignavibacteria bacterium GWB2_35_12]|nr:MAG: hypothetical protein A2X63_11460 [Ignavibacteria bacterium GWA2_35_8]OGU38276.1 MAG: hypothetical protein A2X61_03085 [Ignavibacteria bacterium GWB2_35_12]OGU95497.1 MAG: hypothetical protein A2220_07260 [Ignavibacteria bacterium RIFOXYA2_FULL_35_10]OGV20786.1 MAG: hypothetical protein A2475_11460 [Ignavibacteria bacterium RIFOXYC2_FULL_35_21]